MLVKLFFPMHNHAMTPLQEPWPQTSTVMGAWSCLCRTARVQHSPSPSTGSYRWVLPWPLPSAAGCWEWIELSRHLVATPGLHSLLAESHPQNKVRSLRQRCQSSGLHQEEWPSHTDHRRWLRVPVWDGASSTLWPWWVSVWSTGIDLIVGKYRAGTTEIDR